MSYTLGFQACEFSLRLTGDALRGYSAPRVTHGPERVGDILWLEHIGIVIELGPGVCRQVTKTTASRDIEVNDTAGNLAV